MHYLVGLLVAGAGVVFILYTEWFIQNFGSIAWAEQNLGTNGGSRLMYKLIGLGIIFIGFVIFTDMWNDFLMATVGKIFIR